MFEAFCLESCATQGTYNRESALAAILLSLMSVWLSGATFVTVRATFVTVRQLRNRNRLSVLVVPSRTLAQENPEVQ